MSLRDRKPAPDFFFDCRRLDLEVRLRLELGLAQGSADGDVCRRSLQPRYSGCTRPRASVERACSDRGPEGEWEVPCRACDGVGSAGAVGGGTRAARDDTQAGWTTATRRHLYL